MSLVFESIRSSYARINYNMSMRNIRILEDTFDKKYLMTLHFILYRHGVGRGSKENGDCCNKNRNI